MNLNLHQYNDNLVLKDHIKREHLGNFKDLVGVTDPEEAFFNTLSRKEKKKLLKHFEKKEKKRKHKSSHSKQKHKSKKSKHEDSVKDRSELKEEKAGPKERRESKSHDDGYQEDRQGWEDKEDKKPYKASTDGENTEARCEGSDSHRYSRDVGGYEHDHDQYNPKISCNVHGDVDSQEVHDDTLGEKRNQRRNRMRVGREEEGEKYLNDRERYRTKDVDRGNGKRSGTTTL
eukprot:TRINITY_DN1376_c0_g1_i11.p1 TRINITY_DN1376_c0_g1~~TRINITY_DN1376_c0_g1_i11.p1  ORF type:complete len:231 (-),score=57.02 TRINITY_DN1376_c0_g1_i11:387-1079(-)